MIETQGKQQRKEKSGVVVSNKMAKTVVVRVERNVSHPVFGKVIKRAKKYYAHYDASSTLNEGDEVTIVECRPFSKLKRWRVVQVKGR